jgi:hypothetical protein
MQTVALGHPEPAVVPTSTADVAIKKLCSSPNQECLVINKMVSELERLWSLLRRIRFFPTSSSSHTDKTVADQITS